MSKSIFSNSPSGGAMTVTNLVATGPGQFQEGLTVNYQGTPPTVNVGSVTSNSLIPANPIVTQPVNTSNGDLNVNLGDAHIVNVNNGKSGVFILNENSSSATDSGVFLRNNVANGEATFTVATAGDESKKVSRVRTSAALDGMDFITEGSNKRIRLLSGSVATPVVSGAITDMDISAPHFTPYVQSITASAGQTNLDTSSNQQILVSGSTTHTIRLPSTTSLQLASTTQPSTGIGSTGGAGYCFEIYNTSSGAVTIQSSDGGSIGTLSGGSSSSPIVGKAVCINTSVNGASSWIFATVTITMDVDTLTATGAPLLSIGGTNGEFNISYSGTALDVPHGGTNATNKTLAFNNLQPMTAVGDTIYGAASGAATVLNAGVAGQVLTTQGTSAAPTWSFPGGYQSYNGTSPTLTSTSPQNIMFQGTSAQNVILPSTSLTAGQRFTIYNASTATVTVKLSDTTTTLTTVPSNSILFLTCIIPASAASATGWYYPTLLDVANRALGTPSSGDLTNCTNVNVSSAIGGLSVAHGGTNATTATAGLQNLFAGTFGSEGEMIYSIGSGTVNVLPVGTPNQILTVNSSSVPSWKDNTNVLKTSTTTTSGGTTTLNASSFLNQLFTGTLSQTVVLPDNGLPNLFTGSTNSELGGYQLTFHNNSSAPLTFKTKDNSTLTTLGPNSTMKVTNKSITDNSQAGWNYVKNPSNGTVLGIDQGGTGSSTATGSGLTVLQTSPVFVTPDLHIPSFGNLANCGNLPATGISGVLDYTQGGTGSTTKTGNDGSAVVLANTPTLITPNLGIPLSGNLGNCTNIPMGNATGVLARTAGGTGFDLSGTSGQVLTSNGTSTAPTWTTPASQSYVDPTYQSISGGTTTLNSSSNKNLFFFGGSTAILKLPPVNTILLGTQYFVTNQATAHVTVQPSGSTNTIYQIHVGGCATFTSIDQTVANNETSWVYTIGISEGGTLEIAEGGTGANTKANAFNALQPMTAGGDLIYGGSGGTATVLTNGSIQTFLKANGGTLPPEWQGATGSGNVVLDSDASLTRPVLGTPASGILTNCTNLNFSATGNSGTVSKLLGGTGVSASSNTDLFNQIDPLTTQGDVLYRNATDSVRLGAGTAGQVLTTGGAGANPSWTTPSLSSTSGTVPLLNGGTGLSVSTNTALFNAIDPLTTIGDLLIHDGTNSTRLAKGTTDQFLKSTTASTPVWQGATGSGNVVLDTSAILTSPTLGTPVSGILTNCTGQTVPTATKVAAWDSMAQLNASNFISLDTGFTTANGGTTIDNASPRSITFTTGTSLANQNLFLPATNTLNPGETFDVSNNSNGYIYVYTSNSIILETVVPNQGVSFRVISTQSTQVAANWTYYGRQSSLVGQSAQTNTGSTFAMIPSNGYRYQVFNISGTCTITLPDNSSGIATGPMKGGWWVDVRIATATTAVFHTYAATATLETIAGPWNGRISYLGLSAAGTNVAADYTITYLSTLKAITSASGTPTNLISNPGAGSALLSIGCGSSQTPLQLYATPGVNIISSDQHNIIRNTGTNHVTAYNNYDGTEIAKFSKFQFESNHLTSRVGVQVIGTGGTSQGTPQIQTLTAIDLQTQIYIDGTSNNNQDVKLPLHSAVVASNGSAYGFGFIIKNTSATYFVNVKSNNNTAILTISPGTSASFIMVSDVDASQAAGWSYV